MMLMDITFEAARVLKTCVLMGDDSLLHILCRKESLLQRSLAQTEGHFRTRRGILLDVHFGDFRICFRSFDWNDSSFESSDTFSIQDSDPYMRTGSTQLSTILLEERGFKRPQKAPS